MGIFKINDLVKLINPAGDNLRELAGEQGALDASQDQPASDAKYISGSEKKYLTDFGENGRSVIGRGQDDLKHTVADVQSTISTVFSADIVLKTLKGRIQQLAQEYRETLKKSKRKAREKRREMKKLRFFYHKKHGKHVDPSAMLYKSGDGAKAIFWITLGGIMTIETLLSLWFLSSAVTAGGLVGALQYAIIGSGVAVATGYFAGYLGFRNLEHYKALYRRLSLPSLIGCSLLGLASMVVMANFREAKLADQVPDSVYELLSDPSRWFSISSTETLLLMLVTLLAFLMSAIKGAGGSFSIHSRLPGYSELDQRLKVAEDEHQNDLSDYHAEVSAVIDAQLDEMRSQFSDDRAALRQIQQKIGDAHHWQDVLKRTIADEFDKLIIALKEYRSANQQVRDSAAPAYFNHYPTLESFGFGALDLSQLDRLKEQAESVIDHNGSELAAIEEAIADYRDQKFRDLEKELENLTREVEKIIDDDDDFGLPQESEVSYA